MTEQHVIRKPNLFIAGAPKCGTTAMYVYLQQHPDIFMSAVKEPNYFGKPHPTLRGHVYDEAGYLKLFTAATREKVIGEATPNYLNSPGSAEKIYTFNPDAKIIIMLRSPVELVYSAYYHRQAVGREQEYTTFEEAIFDRTAGDPDTPINSSYWQRTRFTDPLAHYFAVFGREKVHVIIFDDFKNNTEQVYKETLIFLDVDPYFLAEFRIVNAAKQVRYPHLQKVLVRFGLTPQAIKYSRLATLSKVIPQSIREGSADFLRSLYTSDKKPPPMKPETRQQLQHLFLPEVERLSQLLERDLTHWCRDESSLG